MKVDLNKKFEFESSTFRILSVVIVFTILVVFIYFINAGKIKNIGIVNFADSTSKSKDTGINNHINNGIEIGTMNGDIIKDSATKNVNINPTPSKTKHQ